MSEHKLSFSQSQTITWALIGSLPFIISNQPAVPVPLPAPAVPAVADIWPAEGNKGLKKWLKKQWELPVLVVVFPGQDVDTETELLQYLRQDLKNQNTRLICFAPEAVRAQLLPDLWRFKIHHLHLLSDLTPGFLSGLIMREWQEFNAFENQRQRRNHELELLTFLARMNREADFSSVHVSDLAALMQALIQADVLLHVSKAGELQAVYPAPQGISPAWQDIADHALQSNIPDDRPLVLNLDKNHPLHHAAAAIHCSALSASIIFPLRCYEHKSHYFIAFLNEAAISQLDVSRLSLLEKTVEQVRTQLERQVSEERLKAQYQRLQNTLSKLHETQEQLYHSEKLSAVGQLAAGIAHEINNPVSFILSNFEPLDEYIQTMSHMLKLHEEFTHAMVLGDDVIGNQLRQQISEEREAADLEFMLEDIYALVNDSRKGLKRVSEIVTNLRTFSRRDNLDSSQFDLSECIHSAIGLMKYQLHADIDTHIEMPEKALIEGNSGLIGQVVVNLIQNAVHAVEHIKQPEFSLCLFADGTNWILEIRDNGEGIAPEIKDKIFDPFFTTKEIGKGTGLGLSTVYSIIQRHKGQIQVSSEPGNTCFRISLPMAAG